MQFDLVYADPPWAYRNRHLIRKDGKKTRFGIGVAGRYTSQDTETGKLKKGGGVMSFEEIYGLPVETLAAPDCALALWTVPPSAIDCLRTFEEWGFRFVNKFINWTKTYPNGDPFFGTGHYSAGNSEDAYLGVKLDEDDLEDWLASEDCYLGLKGNMVVKSLAVMQDLRTVHPRYKGPQFLHSAKPNNEVRRRLEALFPEAHRKIELFARDRGPGWISTGLDYDGWDIHKALPAIAEDRYPFTERMCWREGKLVTELDRPIKVSGNGTAHKLILI